jgi:rfaE bifunctional protein nucleotidyltransferase chain/domain
VAVALVDGTSLEDAVVLAVGEATRFVEQGGAAAISVPGPAPSVTVGSWAGETSASTVGEPTGESAGELIVAPAGEPVVGSVKQVGKPAGQQLGLREPMAAWADTGAGAAAVPVSAFDVASRVRKTGGRLIATGGCFDLLHAGHVSLLRRARALGDLLVVCVNSDASIRRLKGPSRPVVGQHDRVEVLRALGCVDAVVLFEEDDPSNLIERLRPDVWVKGGDYMARALSEAAAVRRVGGEIVVLPSLPGYSTTRLIAAVQAS